MGAYRGSRDPGTAATIRETRPGHDTSTHSTQRVKTEEYLMATVDVLIPTCRRKTGLAVVLTSLLGQTFTDFNVIVSDQTDDGNYLDSIEITALVLALRRRGPHVELPPHLPRRGLAEQRQFLLKQSRAPYVHYLDD